MVEVRNATVPPAIPKGWAAGERAFCRSVRKCLYFLLLGCSKTCCRLSPFCVERYPYKSGFMIWPSVFPVVFTDLIGQQQPLQVLKAGRCDGIFRHNSAKVIFLVKRLQNTG